MGVAPGTPLASTTPYALVFGFCSCLGLKLPFPPTCGRTAQPKGHPLQEAFPGFFWPCTPTMGPHLRTLQSPSMPLSSFPRPALSPGAFCSGLALVQGWNFFSLALNRCRH